MAAVFKKLRRGVSSTSDPSEGETEDDTDPYGLHDVHDAGPKALVE
jgi:hypothetical protein